ncbi:TetR/AcrR family transcriptional regulator C-terminal domain-containing protein [Nocardia sp. GCM10030253]|uniref:TetR/AcrR family transcriptional regulator C-terminal domain-containing protein n=1 Tax=Nocardia sp. GCM10030253 TaxID=3273404 RepID=UPI00363BEB2E
MPRPRSLTPTAIAAAALAVIDRDGLPALTMRAVAKELHMATMALYRYVPDRDGLEALVVDEIFQAIDVSPPPERDWRDRAAALLTRVRDAAAAHPDAVPLLLRHRQSSVGSLAWIEAMLTVLTDAGFDGRDRVIAQRTLIGFMLGFLQNAHYASLAGAGTAAMVNLSQADYPHLSRTAADAQKVSAVDEFRGGLEIVLRGLTP